MTKKNVTYQAAISKVTTKSAICKLATSKATIRVAKKQMQMDVTLLAIHKSLLNKKACKLQSVKNLQKCFQYTGAENKPANGLNSQQPRTRNKESV